MKRCEECGCRISDDRYSVYDGLCDDCFHDDQDEWDREDDYPAPGTYDGWQDDWD